MKQSNNSAENSEAIEIRKAAVSDYEHIAKWLSDPEINRWFVPWRGREINVTTVSAVAMKNELFLITCDRIKCGLVALGCINTTDCSAVLWYLLGDSSLRGRGIMPRAVSLVVDTAFNALHLRSISASVMGPNAASVSVLQKVGFKPAGVLRNNFLFEGKSVDRIMYDLLPSDRL